VRIRRPLQDITFRIAYLKAIAPTGIVPVRKDEYFKVTYYYGATLYPLAAYWWIPIGDCECVKQ